MQKLLARGVISTTDAMVGLLRTFTVPAIVVGAVMFVLAPAMGCFVLAAFFGVRFWAKKSR